LKKYLSFLIVGMLVIFSISGIALKTNKRSNETEHNKIMIFELPNPYSDEKTCFVEYEQKQSFDNDLYEIIPSNKDSFDYVIITTEDLESSITSSSFIQWKESLGFNIKIVCITDSEINNQQGADLQAKIRNFLREYYLVWGIEYVLIVGDHETIPMKYCYPDPSNHKNTAGTVGGNGGDVPTDYYYADLTSADEDSWDLDGDGYYGEYGDDEPDFQAEISVGRIPTSLSSRITYALDKTVAFEQDTGSWKNSALHGGAFWYFTNENNNGLDALDGATCMNEMEVNLMQDWNVNHYSEQSGLEKSVFNWPALTEEAFAGDWRDGQFSVVNWGAHGWSTGASNKIWSWDDGDDVPENNEFDWRSFISSFSNLDDDHPAIVFGISCVINYPESNQYGNIGIDLLTKPSYGASVGVVASTRSPWGTIDWPNNLGGAESQCYEFNRFMIVEKETVGDAFYKAMYFCTSNYGWSSWAEYNNNYCFNLYGDPSLRREGISGGFPSNPEINGPSSGVANTDYDYIFSSVDPTSEDVYYYIEWGDGSIEEWIGPYKSGEEVTKTHSWSETGTFSIRAKAKDINDEESGWTTFEVSMPKGKKLFSFNQGNFEAEIGINGNDEPIINLDGNYRTRWRFITVNGIASNGDNQVRFQGFFRGSYFVLQVPIRGNIVNIIGRCRFDTDKQEFSGQWSARDTCLRGWIQGTFTSN